MSTVHICLKDILGVAVKCEVIFYPCDTPFQNGTALAITGRRSQWLGDDGSGSVNLAAGRYAVRFGGLTGNTDTLVIEVPDDSATYEFTALITAGTWIVPFRDFLLNAKNLSDVADAAAAFSNIKQAATTSATGVVQLATQAEVEAGTDAAKAVTPATLAAHLGVQLYEVKTAAFTAKQGGCYALGTSAGSFSITIDSALPVGGFIDFADAFGSWNVNPPTFLRNGHLIEGAEVNYVDSAQGTFLRILNVGGTDGLRILEAGTKPHDLTVPTITGQYVGQTFTSTPGTWTGSPNCYVYQWQSSTDGTSWTDIAGATSSTYTADSALLGAYLRVTVAASNSNGTSLAAASAASVALTAAPFPVGAVAFYKLTADASDATGNGNTATNVNAVTFDSSGAHFGGGNYLSTPVSVNLATQSVTIMCWAKITFLIGYQCGVGGIGGQPFIFPYHGNYSGPMWGIEPNSTDLTFSTFVPDTNLHFFLGTYDLSSNTAKFYIDGALGMSTNPNLTKMANNVSRDLSIGSQGGINYLKGTIRDVGVWNRALSAEEVAQLYNSGNGLAYPA